MTYICRDERSI